MLSLLMTLAAGPAFAAEVEVCLSDGQSVRVDDARVEDGRVVATLRGHRLEAVDAEIGVACGPAPEPAVRTEIELVDGQILIGSVVRSGEGAVVRLVDATPLMVDAGLLSSGVLPRDRSPTELDRAHGAVAVGGLHGVRIGPSAYPAGGGGLLGYEHRRYGPGRTFYGFEACAGAIDSNITGHAYVSETMPWVRVAAVLGLGPLDRGSGPIVRIGPGLDLPLVFLPAPVVSTDAAIGLRVRGSGSAVEIAPHVRGGVGPQLADTDLVAFWTVGVRAVALFER